MRAVGWLRRHLVLATAGCAAVAGLGAGVAVLLTGSQAAHSPVGTPAAGAQQAASATKGSAWLAGAGGRRISVLTADLSRVSAAEHAGRQSAARSAGARLAADACVALTGPMPPTDAADYRAALSALKAAGAAAAAGRFGQQQARLLLAGQTGIMRVTAAADIPVGGRTAAVPVTPLGDS